MDLQKYIADTLAADRARQMANSDQLMFIELISKLQAIENKMLPIRFDNGKVPSCLGSWRGVYAELYIGFDGDTNYRNTDEIEKVYPSGSVFAGYTIYKSKNTNLPTEPTAQDMLDLCNDCLGKSFEGWKGGHFVMGKSTPIWVSRKGTSAGFNYGGDPDVYNTKVVGITELEKMIVINTRGDN